MHFCIAIDPLTSNFVLPTSCVMDLDKCKWYGTEEELDALFTTGKLVNESEWTPACKERQKVYKCEDFLKAAEFYLGQNPPDLLQASEKLWGSMVYQVQSLYKGMNIVIKSHRATRALAYFAMSHADSRGTAVALACAFKDGEALHKNFYTPQLSEAEVQELKNSIIYFDETFINISGSSVEQDLQPYIDKKKDTSDGLDNIVFSKAKNLGFKVYYNAF